LNRVPKKLLGGNKLETPTSRGGFRHKKERKIRKKTKKKKSRPRANSRLESGVGQIGEKKKNRPDSFLVALKMKVDSPAYLSSAIVNFQGGIRKTG